MDSAQALALHETNLRATERVRELKTDQHRAETERQEVWLKWGIVLVLGLTGGGEIIGLLTSLLGKL